VGLYDFEYFTQILDGARYLGESRLAATDFIVRYTPDYLKELGPAGTSFPESGGTKCAKLGIGLELRPAARACGLDERGLVRRGSDFWVISPVQ